MSRIVLFIDKMMNLNVHITRKLVTRCRLLARMIDAQYIIGDDKQEYSLDNVDVIKVFGNVHFDKDLNDTLDSNAFFFDYYEEL